MPDTVLVTGISGFLGGHVALALLNAGYRVRGSVRDLARSAKVRGALQRAGAPLDNLEFVALDLRADAGWTEAATGCRYVQHVASPFVATMPKDKSDLVRPAVEGTHRALHAALAAGAERVVLTSSMAAITYGHPRTRTAPFTEADWTRLDRPDVNAYIESKTRAEREAWQIMEQAGRRDALCVVNPSVILGPLLDDDPGTSGALLIRLLNGSLPAVPRVTLGVVDVRDVARMQLNGMRAPDAGGRRHLASAETLSLLQMADALRIAFPAYSRKLPRFELPDWAVRLLALFDAEVRSNTITLGFRRTLDARAGEALLEQPFIAATDAVIATASSLIDFRLA